MRFKDVPQPSKSQPRAGRKNCPTTSLWLCYLHYLSGFFAAAYFIKVSESSNRKKRVYRYVRALTPRDTDKRETLAEVGVLFGSDPDVRHGLVCLACSWGTATTGLDCRWHTVSHR